MGISADLTRTFIVTGGNTGLGFECVSALAEITHGVVVIACRSVGKGELAAQSLRDAGHNVQVMPLDLADQASIRHFVSSFRERRLPPLAGLICNAGAQNVATLTRTTEGYETTFGVNHLGHYLLSRLLLDDLCTGGHITFVSSGTHDPGEKTGMPEPRYTAASELARDFEPGMQAGMRRYTTSKLCNVYCTYEYARRLALSPEQRLQSLRVNAFDPGLMPATGLARTYSAPLRFISRYILPVLALFISNVHSPATSGRRLARLATGGEGSTTGKYYSDGRQIRSSPASYDAKNALDLWDSSAQMTAISPQL